MILLINPNLVDGMWERLLQSLSSSESCIFVVAGLSSGDLRSRVFNDEEAVGLLEKFKSRDYVRIGCSRMIPVPAYFSVNFKNGSGLLMELICLSSERLKKDLLLVCQLSLFENKQLEKLIIPFAVMGLEDPELRFEVDGGETIAHRV